MSTETSMHEVIPTFGITDAELWELVGSVRARHHDVPLIGECGFCGQVWPCGAERLATLADAAARTPNGP